MTVLQSVSVPYLLLGLAVIVVMSIGNPLPDGTRTLDVRPPAAPAAPPGGGSFTVTTGIPGTG